MPLFRRRTADVAPGAAHADSADGVPMSGSLPCSESGCGAQTGVPCSYIDRRFNSCSTSWCARHSVLVDGAPYCRRHAGSMQALVSGDTAEVAPDVESRAASLVAWVSHDMEGHVLAALETVRRPREVLRTEVMRLVFEGRGRQRVWEYTWKLDTNGGFGHWVALRVAEGLDDHLDIVVDAIHVHRSVPPWITNRRAGRVLAAAEDDAQRAAWYAELSRAITTQLALGPAFAARSEH